MMAHRAELWKELAELGENLSGPQTLSAAECGAGDGDTCGEDRALRFEAEMERVVSVKADLHPRAPGETW